MLRVGAVAPLAIAFLAALLGCAAGPTPGGRALLAGDLDAAVPRLRSEVAAYPEDPVIRRNYAIALRRAGQAESSFEQLEIAARIDPRDANTLILLGRVAEETGRPERALEAYGAYLDRTDREEAAVRRRIRDLSIEFARTDIRRALEDGRELAARGTDDAVAVPPFANVSGDERWEPLSRGLAAVMITDLSQVGELRLVERARIRVLQEELQLAGETTESPAPRWPALTTVPGVAERLAHLRPPAAARPYLEPSASSPSAQDDAYRSAVRAFQADHGLLVDGVAGPQTRAKLEEEVLEQRRREAETVHPTVDPATAPRLGALLRAGRFAQGAFTVTGEDGVQLDSFVISARDSSRIAEGEPVPGPLREVLRLEKQVVFQVIDALDIELTTEERRRIAPPATQSYEAFLAFSRGLLLEDDGDLVGARDAYIFALDQDPGFRLAGERLAMLLAGPEGATALATSVEEESAAQGAGADVPSRVLRTGTWIGQGTLAAGGDELDPSITSPRKLDDQVDVIVTGPVPTGGRP